MKLWESCFIINSMIHYLKYCEKNKTVSKNTIEKYHKIISKYEKLENKILNLEIN